MVLEEGITKNIRIHPSRNTNIYSELHGNAIICFPHTKGLVKVKVWPDGGTIGEVTKFIWNHSQGADPTRPDSGWVQIILGLYWVLGLCVCLYIQDNTQVEPSRPLSGLITCCVIVTTGEIWVFDARVWPAKFRVITGIATLFSFVDGCQFVAHLAATNVCAPLLSTYSISIPNFHSNKVGMCWDILL